MPGMPETEPRAEKMAALVETLIALVPEATTVYLFGSEASGQASASSDLDLAVLAAESIAPARIAKAREALAEAVRRDVDLIDLTRASTVMRAQVVSRGTILRDADPGERERFEARVYSAYARLNEERREILERIQREGRIHGR
jgi:predicted nucleotidyltransferase